MNFQHNLFSLVLAILCYGSTYAQLTVQDLAIDTTITGFSFAADFQGTYVYTPNGKSDISGSNKPSAFSFTIIPDATESMAMKTIGQYLKMSIGGGYDQTNVIEGDTTINETIVKYLMVTETHDSDPTYENQTFHAYYFRDDTAIIFISGDLDKGIHIEGFKETLYQTVE